MRRGGRRLGRGAHAPRGDCPCAAGCGPGAARCAGQPLRPSGRPPGGRRLGPRRPEAREHRGPPLGRTAAHRLRRDVPPRLCRAAEPRAGHHGLPAPGPRGRRLGRLARRLPRGADFDGTPRPGARPLACGAPRLGRAALHPVADGPRRSAGGGAHPLRAAGHGRRLPDCTIVVLTHAAALRSGAPAAPCRRPRRQEGVPRWCRNRRCSNRRSGRSRGNGRKRSRRSSIPSRGDRPDRHRGGASRGNGRRRDRTRRGARALCRERAVGLPLQRAGGHSAPLRLRLRLQRGAGGRTAGAHVALHRPQRTHAAQPAGMRGGEALPQWKGPPEEPSRPPHAEAPRPRKPLRQEVRQKTHAGALFAPPFRIFASNEWSLCPNSAI